MALSDTVLAAAIRANLLADPDSLAVANPALDALCSAVAKAVVSHIHAAAVVTIPPGVPVSTAGGPAAQTGATTAPAVGSIT